MDKNTKNKISNLDTLSLHIYNDERFANSYSSKIEYNSHNALYERPATQSLIIDIKGKNVLDAGCGSGINTEWLVDQGANVTAIDFSSTMIALAKERVGDNAVFIESNLNQPLSFLAGNEFDVVVSSMAVHYVKELRLLFSEFNRVLRTGGEFVFSTHHPFMDFSNHPGSNYFETELLEDDWPSYNIKMKFFRRPLGEYFKMLKENGFYVDELLEPTPLKICKEKFPDAYAVLSTQPWFICIRAIKEN